MKLAFFHHLPHGGGFRLLWDYVSRLSIEHQVDVYTFSSEPPPLLGERVRQFTRLVTPLWGLPSPFGRLSPLLWMARIWDHESASRTMARAIDQKGYDAVVVFPGRIIQTPSVIRHVRSRHLCFALEPFRVLLDASLSGGSTSSLPSSMSRFLDGVDPIRSIYRNLAIGLDRENILASRAGVCISKHCQESLLLLYGQRFPVCYPGIDLDRFSPGQANPNSGRFFLSVGPLLRPKGWDFLIRCVARMPPQERIPLVAVGQAPDPREKEALSALAESLAVQFIHEEGVQDQRLLELYRSAVATLYAPILEPLGLVPIESMACQTPVIAVDEGGPRETLADQVGGFLVSRDEDAFCEKMRLLARDPALRITLGADGRRWVERHWGLPEACDRLVQSVKDTQSPSVPVEIKGPGERQGP